MKAGHWSSVSSQDACSSFSYIGPLFARRLPQAHRPARQPSVGSPDRGQLVQQEAQKRGTQHVALDALDARTQQAVEKRVPGTPLTSWSLDVRDCAVSYLSQ